MRGYQYLVGLNLILWDILNFEGLMMLGRLMCRLDGLQQLTV